MFIDGEWRPAAEGWADEDGSFRRKESVFREWISSDPDARFPAERDRYHLYITRICPWASGAALVRRLLGLTDVISMDVLDPWRGEDGWQFSPTKDGCTADSINDVDYLREAYVAADPNYTGRVTVPVLWDTHEDTIVNNESIELMRMFARAFDEYGNEVELYPEGSREEIDRIIDEMYEAINNGVYRTGFAESQVAYEAAVQDVFDGLTYWNDVLADQRYLAGDRLTLADARLFPTLIRFDEVYHTHFKCSAGHITDYEYLWGYLRDLYQTPGFRETVNMDHIKEGYYAGMPSINPRGIIPVSHGEDFSEPHERDRLTGGPPDSLV